MNNIRQAAVVLMLLAVPLPMLAQEPIRERGGRSDAQQEQARERPGRAGAQQEQQPQSGEGVLRLLPADAVSDHTIDLAGGKLAYTATAGTLALYDQNGQRSASVFYTSYAAKDADKQTRPVTFVFNGGPGAASAFLHLGLVGPKVLEFGPNGDAAKAELRTNPDTWLAFTDLVLIDPVGTGWSRPAKPDGGSAFWSIKRDADSIAKTITLYLAKNGRMSSPKYLVGESYGGFRAIKVARALQHDQGVAVSGIVMLSPMIEGSITFGGDRFPLGAALQLPSLVAAELERKKTFSEAALAEAERFALTDYLTTLAGAPPQGEAARAFYARVASLTGLPQDVVAKSRGFVRDAYVKHVRASERKVVSPYDATFAIDDPFPESESASHDDPILDGFIRSYAGAFVGYAREELGFKTDITYALLAEVKWDWQDGNGRRQPSATADLREFLALNPSLRVLIAHGYSDIVTPYSVSRYLLNHLPELSTPNRVALKLYRGGHMFYTDPSARRAFTKDSRAFFQDQATR